ncbi:MAG: alpha-L-fucosidase [Firmicutes bacterium]|nr:alpha-L-fucosidase [Bacillota bacterium]
MSEHEMTGAELRSMLKSSVSLGTMNFPDEKSLHLNEDDTKWWRDAKLGLFIHWGVYSAIGHGEWAYYNEQILPEEYRRIADEKFVPDRSPDEIIEDWMKIAEGAGMKYAVMTARHHDGFAMWDSKSSAGGFTSANYGARADYVRAFTDGCRRHGLHTGLYYSPMDWRFEGYFDPKGKPESALAMKKQAYGQLRELCGDYGKIEILWYDGGWLAHSGTDADSAWLWEPIKMNKMVRELQPKIMVTPRSGYRGDFLTDEGAHPVTGDIIPYLWEKCMSVAASWGYREGDFVYSGDYLIRMMANASCRGGNLLLNIGPDKNGSVPDEVVTSLEKLGSFMSKYGEAFYGTRGGVWQPVDGVYGSTQSGGNVYLHVADREKFRGMTLPLPDGQIISAETFGGDRVFFEIDGGGVTFALPENLPECADTIIKIKII